MAHSMMQMLLVAFVAESCHALSFNVPGAPPANASPQLSSAPIGVSLEFFAFPAYLNDLPSTKKCLQNLEALTGVWPPMRIGGTTQDNALYDPSSANPVTYTVGGPNEHPSSLTYGPSFLSLAATYGGEVILGLNRRLNNILNTAVAAKAARARMPNLYSIEMGNEPNYWSSSDPIAKGTAWTPARDYASQAYWQASVGETLGTTDIFSAGVFLFTGPMNIPGLAAVEGTSLKYVKDFCSHNYAEGGGSNNVAGLMSHSGIKSQISPYTADAAVAAKYGKPYIIGETNSGAQGGAGVGPTYGAALWTMDYSLQMVIGGVKALYFHQGTIGTGCQYCWWGRYDIGAPYYGAYFATLALAGADRIAPLDGGNTAYAAYAIYKGGRPIRVLLYNSDYYTGGNRSQQPFVLTGLSGTSVTAKRLNGASATARQDQGSSPTIAGQTFQDGTCNLVGAVDNEVFKVTAGSATFTVAASQALLIYL